MLDCCCEAGAESTINLPQDEWVMLTFVFANHTRATQHSLSATSATSATSAPSAPSATSATSAMASSDHSELESTAMLNDTVDYEGEVGGVSRGPEATGDLEGGVGGVSRGPEATGDLEGGVGGVSRGPEATGDLEGGVGGVSQGPEATGDLEGGVGGDQLIDPGSASSAAAAVVTESAPGFGSRQGRQHLRVTYPFNYYYEDDEGVEGGEGGEGGHEDAMSPYSYSMSLYVNGRLDVALNFVPSVLGNTEPINLFKDVSFAGPKAFVSDLALWDGVLSDADVLGLYLRGRTLSAVAAAPAPAVAFPSTTETKAQVKAKTSMGQEQQHTTKSAQSSISTSAGGIEGIENGAGEAVDAVDTVLALLREAQSRLVYADRDALDTSESATGSGEGHKDYGYFADTSSVALLHDSVAAALLTYARQGLSDCDLFERRLDLYAEAAERGSAEALYHWAMLLKYGSEGATTNCGVSDAGDYASRIFGAASGTTGAGNEDSGSRGGWLSSLLAGSSDIVGAALRSVVPYSSYSSYSSSSAAAATELPGQLAGPNGRVNVGELQAWTSLYDQERATLALLAAADMGYAPALMPLVVTLLSGHGAEPLLHPHRRISTLLDLPLPASHRVTLPPSQASAQTLLGVEYYKPTRLHAALSRYLLGMHGSVTASGGGGLGCSADLVEDELPGASSAESALGSAAAHGLATERVVGASVLDSSSLLPSAGAAGAAKPSEQCDAIDRACSCPNPTVTEVGAGSGRATHLALGLLHVAAMHGVAEAHLALAQRYRYAQGGLQRADSETAAQYLVLPAQRAADEFHRVGAQPLVEADRIDDDSAPQVQRGNLGQ